MDKKVLIAIALLALVVGMNVLIKEASAEEPVGVSIQGAPAVGVSKNESYTVLVSGGPAVGTVNGSYSIKAWILGENVETGKPLASSPFNSTSKDGKFLVNVTAPNRTGKITLVVEASSKGENETQSQAKKELDIYVVNPIIVDIRIKNNGQTSAKNVTLYLYLDGDLVANRTLANLPSMNTTNVSIEYAPPTLTPGRHVLRIVIDPKRNLVEFDNGNNVLEKEFYLYSPEPDILPYFIALLIVTTVAVVVVFWRASKKKEKLKDLDK
jgi:hypothetical protein